MRITHKIINIRVREIARLADIYFMCRRPEFDPGTALPPKYWLSDPQQRAGVVPKNTDVASKWTKNKNISHLGMLFRRHFPGDRGKLRSALIVLRQQTWFIATSSFFPKLIYIFEGVRKHCFQGYSRLCAQGLLPQ